MDTLARERRLIAQYDEELRRELPEGAELFDVHVHLGHDIDGFSGTYDDLESFLDRYGFSQAFVFCMDEADRHPAFRAPNNRTLAYAARSGGRLIPFARLDLGEQPVEEAVRCLDAGARGIKLHPRAQRFLLDDERLAPIFELAADRRVPILIHGGRGLPPIADHLARLVERYPDAPLIIAHAGIADLAGLTGHFSGVPGVYFDTSVWSPIDLLALLGQVSPEQVLYASDYPYGQQPTSLLMTIRTARLTAFDEAQLQGLLGGGARRIAAGGEPPALSSARGSSTFSQPMTFARIHQYLAMTTSLLWTRQPDTIGMLGLALNACFERDGHQPEREQIRELLETAREVWRTLPEVDGEQERRQVTRAAFRMIQLADILAVTTAA
jgi:uncharacterized protein